MPAKSMLPKIVMLSKLRLGRCANTIRTDRFYRIRQFRMSLAEVVTLNNLEMVQWLCDKFPKFDIDEYVVLISMKDISIKILQFFLDNDPETTDINGGHRLQWNEDVMAQAVLDNRHDVLWWLKMHISADDFDQSAALDCAARQGDITVAEWLIDQDVTFSRATPRNNVDHNIAAQGRLNILKWLVEGGKLVDGLVVKAAANGHLHVVLWLMNPDLNLDDESDSLTDLSGEAVFAIHAAPVNGHLEVAKYLLQQTSSISSKQLRSSRYKEQLLHLSSALYATDEAAIISPKTMTEAARNGHLEVVQWLDEESGNDPDIDIFNCSEVLDERKKVSAMDAAAGNGLLDVIKYVHALSIAANGKKRKRDTSAKLSVPTCTKKAMDNAAANGHLHAVKWLRDNRSEGCSARSIDGAATGGHLHVVKWFHQYRAESCTTAAMNGAAKNGHLRVVLWFHDNTSAKCTTAAMDGAAAMGHLNVVQWLHEHRHEGCTTSAMDGAGKHGALNVIKWLHVNRHEGCTKAAIDLAATHGHLGIVQWLASHRSEGYSCLALEGATGNNHLEVFLFL